MKIFFLLLLAIASTSCVVTRNSPEEDMELKAQSEIGNIP